MKVLLINSVYKYGSTGRIVDDLKDFYSNNGIETYVAYGRNQRKFTDKHIIRIGSKFTQLIHLFGSRIFDLSGRLSILSTLIFIRKIKKISFDVIHIHNLHGYYINYPILFNYIKKNRIKTIFTLHDSWMLTGHCTNFQNVDCDKWMTKCQKCPLTRSYPKSFIDNSRANFKKKTQIWKSYNESIIITPSVWLMNYAKQSKLKNQKIDYIHNGIDINVFKPNIDVNEKNDYVLAVSNVWNESKGLFELIKIEKEIEKRGLTLVVIGVLEKQKKLFSNKSIVMSRTKNINELIEWYNKSLIFINPTFEDNYPTVNMEAISCGTPVITYPTGGSPESIISNNGITTGSKKINDILDAIDKIRDNYEFYYRNCLETKFKFDKNIYLLKYLSYVKEIVGSEKS